MEIGNIISIFFKKIFVQQLGVFSLIILEKSTFSESTFSTQFHGQVNAKVLVSGHGSAVHFNESQSEGMVLIYLQF